MAPHVRCVNPGACPFGRLRSVLIWVAVLAGAVHGADVCAQVSASKPVRLITAGAPGSVPDLLARALQERLAAHLKRTVIVENHPSAGGIVAMNIVARATPDGSVIGLVSTAQMVFNTYLFETLPYDALRDFTPVTLLVRGQGAIAANPLFPANSVREFVELAKMNPGRIEYAIAQLGSPPHIFALELARMADIDMVAVPFHTAPEAIANVVSGEVPIVFEAPFVLAPFVRAGKLKPLAIIGSEPEPLLPGTPTLAANGFGAVRGDAWLALVLPANAPAMVIENLDTAAREALREPQLQPLLAQQGWQVLASSRAEFVESLRRDHTEWSHIIRGTGLKLQ